MVGEMKVANMTDCTPLAGLTLEPLPEGWVPLGVIANQVS